MSLSLVAGVALALSGCLAVNQQSDQPVFQVAVVDRFYPGDEYYADEEERLMQMSLHGYVDLDRDHLREPLYHGDIVSILASHPDIQLHPYEMRQGQHPQKEILRQLKNIRKHIFWGDPIHAVVLSWESSTLISAFEKPLREENAEHYKQVIRKWGAESDIWRLTFNSIRVMEDIVESGVKVFTIAGNGGRGMVNTYSFADGVTTVGAEEKELQHFISDNVFVDVHTTAGYQPLLVRDGNGRPQGYDFDGDRCADVTVTCLSSYQSERLDYPSKPWPMLKGSSFAAPVAMKLALLKDGTSARLDSDGQKQCQL